MPSGTAALPVLASGSSDVFVSPDVPPVAVPVVPPVVALVPADGVAVLSAPESSPLPLSAPAKVTGIRTVWLWSPPRVWSLRVITEQVTPGSAQSVLASLARTSTCTEKVPLCPAPLYGSASPSPYEGGLEEIHTEEPESPDMSTPPIQGVGVLLRHRCPREGDVDALLGVVAGAGHGDRLAVRVESGGFGNGEPLVLRAGRGAAGGHRGGGREQDQGTRDGDGRRDCAQGS